jgi:integrase
MAAKFLPKRGGWHVSFTYVSSEGSRSRIRRQSPVNTKRGAQEFERQLRNDLLNPAQDKKRKEVPTLRTFSEEFIEGYAKANNKPSEIITKQSILRVHLLPAFGRMRLDQIRVRQIEKFKAKKLGQKLKKKTINNILAVLGRLLNYAEECEVIEQSPRVRMMTKVPKPDFDYLTFEEADRLLVAVLDRPDWHAMVFTALRTGMRFGEITELRWSDVDLVAGKARVKRSFTRGFVTTPKNGKPRTIPLSPKTVAVLRRLRGLKHLKGGLVFCKPDGGRRIHRRSDVAIKRLSRIAELGRLISWHVLRHTFASHLVIRGRSLKEIQELLGHSDITMTMRYAHIGPSELASAVAVLDEKNGTHVAQDEIARLELLQAGDFKG